MTALLDKRLIFVCGKGGVGRSTVSIALGLLAARRGLRTIVAEVARQDHVARALGEPPGGFHIEHELAPGLWTISIDPEQAMEEYLRVRLRLRPVADVLTGSRTFGYLTAATPGMRELLTVGKIWELAQLERRSEGGSHYDLVIVDAPATGHGLAVLRAPRTFAEVARVGPVARQGMIIHRTLVDSSFTGVVAVARPEEMPVNETLAMVAELRGELGVELDRCVANAVHPDRFDDQAERVLRLALGHSASRLARIAVRAALAAGVRAEGQRAQLGRLADGLEEWPAELPFLFAERLDLPAFEHLSRELEAAL